MAAAGMSGRFVVVELEGFGSKDVSRHATRDDAERDRDARARSFRGRAYCPDYIVVEREAHP